MTTKEKNATKKVMDIKDDSTSQVTEKEIREKRRARKEMGFKLGAPVVDLTTGRRLVFLRPGKNQMIRCSTIKGFAAAEKAFKDEVNRNALSARTSVSCYIPGTESVTLPEKNLVTVITYEERANSPENAKLLKEAKSLETQIGELQTKLTDADSKLAQIHNKIATSLRS